MISFEISLERYFFSLSHDIMRKGADRANRTIGLDFDEFFKYFDFCGHCFSSRGHS